jgi:hypothetical protein
MQPAPTDQMAFVSFAANSPQRLAQNAVDERACTWTVEITVS